MQLNSKALTPSQIHLLVIEDEKDLRNATVSFLLLDEYIVHGVGSAAEADLWLKSNPCDAIILDLGLPDVDGLTWLSRQRNLSSMAVIATTARGASIDRILGARSEIDIYLVKPVQLEELSLVILNLVRRIKFNTSNSWTISKKSWILRSPNNLFVKLTRLEMLLLGQFIGQPGVVLAKEILNTKLGYEEHDYDPRRMEILIRRLRQKVLTNLNIPLPLETVHKKGFAFVADLLEEI